MTADAADVSTESVRSIAWFSCTRESPASADACGPSCAGVEMISCVPVADV